MHRRLLFLLSVTFIFVTTPKVTCGPEKISIQGQTEDIFEGTVFIKNWRRTAGCSTTYSVAINSTNPSFSIPLDRLAQCGLELRRTATSKELEIFTIFVFSFHPNFVTAGDRSFAVHCIFVQQQMTVATKFNFISDISTKGIISGKAEAPKVEMLIQPDSDTQSRNVVKVGEKLLYIWKISKETEIYGLRVHQCFAETQDGRRMKVMNDGCSVDNDLITHPKYAENNAKAFANGLAFKFPDAEDITITCVVQTCIQKFEHLIAADDKNLCDSMPQCNKRSKRSVDSKNGTVEVYSMDNLVHHRLRVIDASSLPLFMSKLNSYLTSQIQFQHPKIK
ncbi:unnamed protein product [Enterobius vermicularis]|uniref:ZP domain-containing protein n=1 Tax=Enterobius vermicularis TaxID=51028 RepID=A0A0N4V8U3_ENTVE|nr:unnamed protein product [Enterobius vermicularis]